MDVVRYTHFDFMSLIPSASKLMWDSVINTSVLIDMIMSVEIFVSSWWAFDDVTNISWVSFFFQSSIWLHEDQIETESKFTCLSRLKKFFDCFFINSLTVEAWNIVVCSHSVVSNKHQLTFIIIQSNSRCVCSLMFSLSLSAHDRKHVFRWQLNSHFFLRRWENNF